MENWLVHRNLLKFHYLILFTQLFWKILWNDVNKEQHLPLADGKKLSD